MCAHPGKLDLADFENVRKPVAMVLAEREWGGFASIALSGVSLCARSDALRITAPPTEDHIFDDQKPAALAIFDRIKSQHAVPIAVYDQHVGTTHGFGCRPDLENGQVRKAWERAAEETVGWFEGHL